MTSHDVISWLRKLFNLKRIGHGGTLDPNAVGVLPIAVGRATRLLEYILESDKEYRCEMILGIVTTTQDLDGDLLEKKSVSKKQLENFSKIAAGFKGEITQMPPMVSAVRYQGKRLYQLNREGKTVPRKSRKVFIHELNVLRTTFCESYASVFFDVICSKGTYIRTLCHDLGQSLGCGGAMSFLIRTKVGLFALEEAYTLEEIQTLWQKGEKSFLMSLDKGLSLPVVRVADEKTLEIVQGKRLELIEFLEGPRQPRDTKVQIIDSQGFIGIGDVLKKEGKYFLHPRKVLR